MGLKVTNNAFGTLNAGITNSATTIVLTAGQGARFPTLSAGDYFYATLIDTSNNLEIVKVTARSTDTMTVVRGQDNTTARAYSTNDRFELRPTAVMLNEIITTAEAAFPKAGGEITGNVRIGGDAFGQPLRRLTVREDATDSTFKGLKVINAGGSGAVAGVFLQAYDWVQGGVWHGRTASGTERSGALILGTNPNTSDLSEGGLIGRVVIDNAGRVRTPYQPMFKAIGNYQNQDFTNSQRITFPDAYTNVGSHYNTSTSQFTAPVAGMYLFTAQIFFNDSTVDRLGFTINGSLATNPYGGHRSGIYGATDVLTYVLYLNANDAIGVQAQYYTHTVYGYHSGFQGFLIG